MSVQNWPRVSVVSLFVSFMTLFGVMVWWETDDEGNSTKPALLSREWTEKPCADHGDCPAKYACMPFTINSGSAAAAGTGGKNDAAKARQFRCAARSLVLDFSISDVLCTLFVFVTAFLSAGSGVGGGGVFVPLFLILLNFSAKEAVPLSKACCLTGSLINIVLFLPERNPVLASRTLVDFDVVAVLNPPLLAGITLGVIGHKMSPDWVVVLLLLSTLIFAFKKSWAKGVTRWREETKMLLAQEEEANANEGNDNSSGSSGESAAPASATTNATTPAKAATAATEVRGRDADKNPSASSPNLSSSPGRSTGKKDRNAAIRTPGTANKTTKKTIFGRRSEFIAVSGFEEDENYNSQEDDVDLRASGGAGDGENTDTTLHSTTIIRKQTARPSSSSRKPEETTDALDLSLFSWRNYLWTWQTARKAIEITTLLCVFLFFVEYTKAPRCTGLYWLEVVFQLAVCLVFFGFALRRVLQEEQRGQLVRTTDLEDVDLEELGEVGTDAELERTGSVQRGGSAASVPNSRKSSSVKDGEQEIRTTTSITSSDFQVDDEEDDAASSRPRNSTPAGNECAQLAWAEGTNRVVFPLYAGAAGFVGGFLGIGGGMLLSPVLLDLGLLPEVTQATTAMFVFLSSALAMLQFFLLDLVMPSYVCWYGFWVFVATAAGQFLLKKLLQLYQRKSLIILSVAAIIFLSMVLMTLNGLYRLYIDYTNQDWEALSFSFSKLCH
ncbi:unnamed protein product [Amoebophrya sp. A120]|nr:unnamed protein product [Amoebophrya sp. A120]|eukprot:GSA120T00011475001.1